MNIHSEAQARLIAERAIADKGHDFRIDSTQIQERVFGWVYRYFPARYIETRNSNDLVPGMGPLVVLRDGTFEFLATDRPPATKIATFEDEWLLRRDGKMKH